MLKYDLAVLYDSEFTSIYKLFVDVVLFEKTKLAYKITKKNKQVLAYGNNVVNLLESKNVDNDIVFVDPVLDGVIVDLDDSSLLLKQFLNKLEEYKPNMLMITPDFLNVDEVRQFERVGYLVNANSVILLPSVLCNVVGLGFNPKNESYITILKIDSTCSLGVVNFGKVVFQENFNIGSKLNNEIENYIKITYNIIPTIKMIQSIRNNLVALIPGIVDNVEISGNDIDTNEFKICTITSKELFNLCVAFFNKIVDNIVLIMKKLSPEIIESINLKGLYVVGDLSDIIGVGKFLKTKLKLNIQIAKEKFCTITGAGLLLKSPKLLEHLIEINKIN